MTSKSNNCGTIWTSESRSDVRSARTPLKRHYDDGLKIKLVDHPGGWKESLLHRIAFLFILYYIHSHKASAENIMMFSLILLCSGSSPARHQIITHPLSIKTFEQIKKSRPRFFLLCAHIFFVIILPLSLSLVRSRQRSLSIHSSFT